MRSKCDYTYEMLVCDCCNPKFENIQIFKQLLNYLWHTVWLLPVWAYLVWNSEIHSEMYWDPA